MRKNTILLLILLVVCLMFAMVFYRSSYLKSGQQEINNKQLDKGSEFNTFKSSELLGFTIEVPERYTVREEVGTVVLVAEFGEIKIGRSGTNGNNLDEYFEYRPDNILERMQDKEELNIDGSEAVRAKIDERKTYFIYATEYTVYLLSTEYPELYSDLDQIAQSFRYTPN